MSHVELLRFGHGMEDSDVSVFNREMKLKLRNCGVELPEHAKILEVGSGNGKLLTFLQKEGFDVEGIDIEPRGEGVKKADIAALPYENESFDCVISKQVFDSVLYSDQSEEKREAMLREIARVLKKDGIYYVKEFVPIEGFELMFDPSGNQNSALYKKI